MQCCSAGPYREGGQMSGDITNAVIALISILVIVFSLLGGIRAKKKKMKPLPNKAGRSVPEKGMTSSPSGRPGTVPSAGASVHASGIRNTAPTDKGHDIRSLYRYEGNRKWICRNCETENVESAVFCCVCLQQRY